MRATTAYGIGATLAGLAMVVLAGVGMDVRGLGWTMLPAGAVMLACAVRFIDHVEAGPKGPGRFSLLGWLRD